MSRQCAVDGQRLVRSVNCFAILELCQSKLSHPFFGLMVPFESGYVYRTEDGFRVKPIIVPARVLRIIRAACGHHAGQLNRLDHDGGWIMI